MNLCCVGIHKYGHVSSLIYCRCSKIVSKNYKKACQHACGKYKITADLVTENGDPYPDPCVCEFENYILEENWYEKGKEKDKQYWQGLSRSREIADENYRIEQVRKASIEEESKSLGRKFI